MKVLSIGSDRKLFEEGSDVQQRIIEYGTLFEELHVVVFTTKNLEFGIWNLENVWIYPTNSRSKLFYIFDAIKVGKKIVLNSKFKIQDSVITCQDPFESGLAGWLIARKTGAKLQLQIHTDFLSPYFRKKSFLNRIRFFVACFLIPKADCIRVVSNRIKERLKAKSYKLKAEPMVLPVFVDIEKARNTEPSFDLHTKYPQFDFIILMVSRLTKEKNISLALNALKKTVTKHPNIGLIIIGEGPEREMIQPTINDAHLTKNVILKGWQEDLISYYKTADLYLLTSNYEGYGRTLVEAAASDCPIVTTDVGVAGEILTHKNEALVCAQNDVECITQSIMQIMGNKALQSILPLKAQEALEQVKMTKEEYLREYKQSFEMCYDRGI